MDFDDFLFHLNAFETHQELDEALALLSGMPPRSFPPVHRHTALSYVRREVHTQQALVKHTNVCALHEVINDDTADCLWLVLEHCAGGDVLKMRVDGETCCYENQALVAGNGVGAFHLGGVPLGMARKFAREMLSAVDFMHAHGIIHRDIKPDNFMLHADGGVRLADFGTAVQLDAPAASVAGEHDLSASDRWMSGDVGTKPFLSPEVVRHPAQFDAYASDVWAAGVTVYALVFGRLPFFAGQNESALRELISAAELHWPVGVDAKATEAEREQYWLVTDFLRHALRREPTERDTARRLLQHAWLAAPVEECVHEQVRACLRARAE